MNICICNDCPCLNDDMESGCECNLRYETFHQKKIGYFSNNCSLLKIITKDKEYDNVQIEISAKEEEMKDISYKILTDIADQILQYKPDLEQKLF
jgi:hypothetical protein